VVTEQGRAGQAHDPAARAYQIRGLIEVGRVTGTGHLLNDAAASFRSTEASSPKWSFRLVIMRCQELAGSMPGG
jgi:hypothetical protein